MKILKAILFLCITISIISCTNTQPLVKNKSDEGYFEIITELNFDSIASSRDTAWQINLTSVISLLKSHPRIKIMFHSYLGTKSDLPDDKKADYITLLKIVDYLKSQGISPSRFGAMSGGNSAKGGLDLNLQPKINEVDKIRLQENVTKKYRKYKYVLIWKVEKL